MDRKIFISLIPTINRKKKVELLNSDISIKEIFHKLKLNQDIFKNYEEIIRWLEKPSKYKKGCIYCTDDRYPKILNEYIDGPFVLYYIGTFPSLNNLLTIVGTRVATNRAKDKAYEFGLESGLNKIGIISGFAKGIDQAATLGAIKSTYPNWAVVGSGLEYEYPHGSNYIKEKMLECGGGVISLFLPNCPPLKTNFKIRNLVLATISNATLVVQCPQRSGSLITAQFALDMGLPVFVHSVGIGYSYYNKGTTYLNFCGAKIVNCCSDLLKYPKYEVFEDYKDGRFYFNNKKYNIRKYEKRV